jgi:hypothetical protein
MPITNGNNDSSSTTVRPESNSGKKLTGVKEGVEGQGPDITLGYSQYQQIDINPRSDSAEADPARDVEQILHLLEEQMHQEKAAEEAAKVAAEEAAKVAARKAAEEKKLPK